MSAVPKEKGRWEGVNKAEKEKIRTNSLADGADRVVAGRVGPEATWAEKRRLWP